MNGFDMNKLESECRERWGTLFEANPSDKEKIGRAHV